MSAARVPVRIASSRAELAGHMAVRQRVFVEEQRFFETTDRDIWDENALHAVAVDEERGVVGAVRFYALDEAGLWKGDRLAVVAEARPLRVGARLVRFAVK
ncbi:MAG: MSMEG_0567/Sll0786 family nitrogen starvation N-acetyltransferase, partial [Miltoncostaeaceae bacterium]